MSTPRSDNTVRQYDPALLDEYLSFLRSHRGLAKATIGIRASYVAPFLAELNLRKTPAGIDGILASHVHDYVIRTARSMTRSSRKHLVSSLRSFLRFAHLRGYTERSLIEAVPVIRTHKLGWHSSRHSMGISREAPRCSEAGYSFGAKRLRHSSAIGYLRRENRPSHCTENSGYRLATALVRFTSSKKGHDLCFPLTHGVAEALLAYFRDTRGTAAFPRSVSDCPWRTSSTQQAAIVSILIWMSITGGRGSSRK